MNLGPLEIVFIVVFALIVFGPKRLPGLARSVGAAMREFKKATQELTEDLRIEVEDLGGHATVGPPPQEPRPGPRP